MKLIIAEKPSLARNIADSIGGMRRRDGYIEGEEYLITWAFGHLFSLCDIEKYSPNPNGEVRWTMANLPCFPKKFEFELRKDKNKQTDAGVRKQYNTIAALCRRDDVTEIINAGDADREGEIIIRLCVRDILTPEKTFKRLWLPDQTSETIREALSDMKDESEYDNLANEGFARTFIDWLYGVNLTRYATLKTGTLMRVGRVIVPIVKAIYDRDMAIRNFKSDIYYALVSKTTVNGEEIELTSKHKFNKNDLDRANRSCNVLNSAPGIVTKVKSKKDTLSPGKLYSLSKLQNVLGKKYKMSMDDSLKIVQSLYEKGYVTYPRTNSEYLATAEQGKIKEVISKVSSLGYPVEFKFKKTIFDDSKIESHSALTPTRKIPDKSVLSSDETKVYSAIMRRFTAVFCAEECVVKRTELTIDASGKEEYNVKGMVVLEPGWTKYDDFSRKNKVLPILKKGDEVPLNFKPVEKQTSPPKHYTIETLNNYLKNPFRDEKANMDSEDDELEYKAMFEGLELGTEATRTGIIDNAVKSEYIELKKDVYRILPAGERLIESIARMNISMDKYRTAALGKALKQVFRGEISVDTGVELAVNEIKQVFSEKTEQLSLDHDDGFMGDIVCNCPVCGKNIVRTTFGYGCSAYRETGCRFSVSGVICSRVIPKSAVKSMIENGKSQVLEEFISPKSGKKFSAALRLDENNRTIFDFGT